MFDHGHFAEISPGQVGKKTRRAPALTKDWKFPPAHLDEIDAIAGIVFMENFTTGGKMPSWAIKRNACKLVAAQIAKTKQWIQSAATSAPLF